MFFRDTQWHDATVSMMQILNTLAKLTAAKPQQNVKFLVYFISQIDFHFSLIATGTYARVKSVLAEIESRVIGHCHNISRDLMFRQQWKTLTI